MQDHDRADIINDLMDKVALQNQKRRSNALREKLLPIGECLFCEEPLPPGLRWCGVECRDDWEKMQ